MATWRVAGHEQLKLVQPYAGAHTQPGSTSAAPSILFLFRHATRVKAHRAGALKTNQHQHKQRLTPLLDPSLILQRRVANRSANFAPETAWDDGECASTRQRKTRQCHDLGQACWKS